MKVQPGCGSSDGSGKDSLCLCQLLVSLACGSLIPVMPVFSQGLLCPSLPFLL